MDVSRRDFFNLWSAAATGTALFRAWLHRGAPSDDAGRD